MIPLEVHDAIKVEDLEEVEAQAVGVGHREDREDHEQLRMLDFDIEYLFLLFLEGASETGEDRAHQEEVGRKEQDEGDRIQDCHQDRKATIH
jgi:hypothetical protein